MSDTATVATVARGSEGPDWRERFTPRVRLALVRYLRSQEMRDEARRRAVRLVAQVERDQRELVRLLDLPDGADVPPSLLAWWRWEGRPHSPGRAHG